MPAYSRRSFLENYRYLFVSTWILLLTISSALQAYDCYDIICNKAESADTCINVVDSAKTVTINPCTDSKSCPSISKQLSTVTTSWTNENCVPSDPESIECPTNETSVHNGFYCCKNEDCVSGICEGSWCKGKSIGIVCYSDLECESDTYCKGLSFISKTGKCTAAIESDGACAYDDYCGIGYGCNDGKCTQLYSLKVGSTTDDKRFCVTDFEVGGICEYLDVYIGNSKIDSPYKCYIGSTCSYWLNNQLLKYSTSPCHCSGLGNTTGYCGDYIEFTLAYEDFFPKFGYNSSKCSGVDTHTDNIEVLYNCGSISKDAYDYYNNLHGQAMHWAVFQSGAINDCSSSLDLYEPSYTLSSYGKSQFLTISRIFLLIYIIN
ncbi:unnamed protein product [Blepharisma stoltei]|uniref:Uncharacterized protein n=1 Tax=Blepharisma stoltei TaxID=1481888 RepID=A0AAU9JJA5_9CILI|nr:unnamed protein product [Blepharisma stoltei]